MIKIQLITEAESVLTPSDDLLISAQEKRPVKEEILFFKKCCVDNDILQLFQTMDKDKKGETNFQPHARWM